jgi:hypothetical protein
MKIGDVVLSKGGLYYLRGFDPMGVENRRAELEDVQTGEIVNAPLDRL